MRFGPRDKFVDRAVRRVLLQARRQRLRRQVGRADRRIDAPAHQRNGEHGGHADGADAPAALRRRRRLPQLVGLQDPPCDLGARLFGLGRLDQPARGVAVEFGKLVAIDFEVMGSIGRAGRVRPASGRSTARLAPSVSKAAMTQNSMASQIDLGTRLPISRVCGGLSKTSLPALHEQFQEKWNPVFRPEWRQNTDQVSGVQLPSGLRQAVPRAVCFWPSARNRMRILAAILRADAVRLRGRHRAADARSLPVHRSPGRRVFQRPVFRLQGGAPVALA